MNIAHLLLGSAREFRDLPALARGTATHLTYRDLWRKVSVMSMHLRGRFGLARGDRVAFAMSNGVEAIEVMYAIWHAGLCAVPMNAKLHAREFAFILENSVLLLFGGFTKSYSTNSFISFSSGIHIGDVNIDSVQITIFVVSIAMMFGLMRLVDRTTLGKSMRAVASDREAAEMLGINVDRVISYTFFIGSAMAGVAVPRSDSFGTVCCCTHSSCPSAIDRPCNLPSTPRTSPSSRSR